MSDDATDSLARLAEAEKRDDQEALASLATTNASASIRRKAANLVRDEAVLRRIITSDPNSFVRAAAVQGVTSAADLAAIIWSNDDRITRVAAVARLSDVDALADIVLRHRESEVRDKAAARWRLLRIDAVRALSNQEDLFRIALTDPDPAAQGAAMDRLDDDVLRKLLGVDSPESVRLAVVRRIAAQPDLISIALNDPSPGVRATAIARVSDPQVLVGVTASDPYLMVREAAAGALAAGEAKPRNRGKKLFVGNLSFATTSADLEQLFRRVGETTLAVVITDRESGRARGFGFVEMASDADARRAIVELDGKELQGRTINVNEARDRPPAGSGGGASRPLTRPSPPTLGEGGRPPRVHAQYEILEDPPKPNLQDVLSRIARDDPRPDVRTMVSEMLAGEGRKRTVELPSALALYERHGTGPHVAGEPSVEAVPGDDVRCSIYAPPDILIGHTMMVQAFVHLPTLVDEAEQLARTFDDEARQRGFRSLESIVERGTRLDLQLHLPTLDVADPVQQVIWEGRTEGVQFAVTATNAIKPGPVIGRLLVSAGSVPLGHLSFKLVVTDTPKRHQPCGLGDDAVLYSLIFISYASADRAEVLKRVQMLRVLKQPFFQDILSLDPGDRWERKLYEKIDECDLFLLFWSHAARESEWVLRETRRAVACQAGREDGKPRIIPVLIESPPPVPPPDDLKHLHFNDPILYFTVPQQP